MDLNAKASLVMIVVYFSSVLFDLDLNLSIHIQIK